MAQSEDVADAVLAQVAADGRNVDDLTQIMGKDLLYAEPTMDGFLVGLSTRLLQSNYVFNPPPPAVGAALQLTVEGMIGTVDRLTTPAAGG